MLISPKISAQEFLPLYHPKGLGLTYTVLQYDHWFTIVHLRLLAYYNNSKINILHQIHRSNRSMSVWYIRNNISNPKVLVENLRGCPPIKNLKHSCPGIPIMMPIASFCVNFTENLNRRTFPLDFDVYFTNCTYVCMWASS